MTRNTISDNLNMETKNIYFLGLFFGFKTCISKVNNEPSVARY